MLSEHWFSETYQGYGVSLQIKERVHEEQTPYQKIQIYETERFGHLMTLDDVIMLTSRDHFIYHEMMTHPVLFTHPNPRRVAIVGGGDCGALREVLCHRGVEHVILVELDERVTRVSERYFQELCAANSDPRVELLFQDAVEWMDKVVDASSYDVLILDTTDPVGQAERLFAAPFYRNCHRALADGGLLVAQSESPLLDEDVLKRIRVEMRTAGFKHFQTLFFAQPTYPSGWWSATMARKGQGIFSFREYAAEHKDFPTRYYNASMHKHSTAMPEFIRQLLKEDENP
ncbi:MAG: polyamine aminopropyltransferase [Candidatus Eutrophobiaceae bacterium]